MMNNIKLKRLEITGLFGYKNVCINFNDVTVIVGKNGLGKTTILKILNALLTADSDCRELSLCSRAAVLFTDSDEIAIEYKAESDFLKEIKRGLVEKLIADGKLTGKNDISHIDNYEYTLRKIISRIYLNDEIVKQKPEYLLLQSLFPEQITLSETIEDYITKKCEIRYISTINMSANALRDITMSSGQDKNLLNWELMIELKELAKEENSPYRDRFIKQASALLRECDKCAEFRGDNFYAKDVFRNAEINIENLSSGERQLLYILSRVANTKDKPSFFLMDEPEISLHLNWQEKLISTIKELNPWCQIIIVTHSPAIVMDGFMDCYVDMNEISSVRTDVGF
ncbi:AAA family ATPase [Escherichia coli]|uniref:AAA family ATPase n=1 Tax=Escherichia coli TaxID=562 RepID=UPI0028704788|nr:AAA family ATPase [Escherichia coli]MDR9379544.1 AAA family ATPase [Escherichia coli]